MLRGRHFLIVFVLINLALCRRGGGYRASRRRSSGGGSSGGGSIFEWWEWVLISIGILVYLAVIYRQCGGDCVKCIACIICPFLLPCYCIYLMCKGDDPKDDDPVQADPAAADEENATQDHPDVPLQIMPPEEFYNPAFTLASDPSIMPTYQAAPNGIPYHGKIALPSLYTGEQIPGPDVAPPYPVCQPINYSYTDHSSAVTVDHNNSGIQPNEPPPPSYNSVMSHSYEPQL